MTHPPKSTPIPAPGDTAPPGPVSTPGRTDLNDPHHSGDARPGRSDAGSTADGSPESSESKANNSGG